LSKFYPNFSFLVKLLNQKR